MRKNARNQELHPAVLEPLEPRLLLSTSVLVTEFMASNDLTIMDGDGNSSDWIELYNPTDEAVNLAGWFLTDDAGDLNQWSFPGSGPGDVMLDPDERMLVFASGQDSDDYPYYDGTYYHTNFRLGTNDGDQHDSVLLVADDGATIAHGYYDYPLQLTDVSYGIYLGDTWNTLVGAGSQLSYHLPTPGDGPDLPEPGVSEGWTAVEFDDSSWTNTTRIDAAGMIITEVDSGTVNFVEIQNASDAAISTTGWAVLVNDGSGTINSVNILQWDLPASVAVGEVLYRSDDPGDAGHYWGGDIDWTAGEDGWAMIVDGDGEVVDFVAWGYDAAGIASLSFDHGGHTIDVTGQWTGDGAVVGDGTGGGEPGPEEDVVVFSSEWFYMHPLDGTDPVIADLDFNTTWMIPDGYDGPAFSGSGPGVLGYDTIAYSPVVTDIVKPADGDRYTAYFRRELVLETNLLNAGIEILSDDGAVVYIDGIEVTRNNMQAADIYTALADDASETETRTYTLVIPDISAGLHWIAVSVHQANTNSSDLGFAMRLFGQPASDPGSVLQRTGDTDSNVAVDFLIDDESGAGAHNPDLVVPFGEISNTMTGIGFSDSQDDFEAVIVTDTADEMLGVNASLWTRIEFESGDVSGLQALTLSMKYDDGFIAYLNGTEVARRNAPVTLAYDSQATAEHADVLAVVYEDIDITAHMGLVQAGTNILAIHGLNLTDTDGDFLILPRLVASSESSEPRYFGNPTPGLVNDPSLGAPVSSVEFSRPSDLFTEPSITVELSTDSPSAVIYYTLDGTIPTNASTEYTAALTISGTTQVRARAYEFSELESLVTTETYVKLDPGISGYSSDLPVIVIDTFGSGGLPQDWFETCFISLFDRKTDGWTDFAGGMDLASRAGLRIRGSSNKDQYALEFWDEFDEDKDLEVLGMPAESDWILYRSGPDVTYMNNTFLFELSNQFGQYAARTRFVEVYLNTDGGQIGSSDHKGVYVLIEKIKRGSDRVDVEQLGPTDTAEPDVSGGYMFKIDRIDPGDGGFSAGGQHLLWVYPKEDVIETPAYDAQENWIKSYIDEYRAAINASNFINPSTGKHYSEYFDVPAAIDYHLLNELSKNQDEFRLSTFLYKPRDGKLTFGPLWDMNGAMGSIPPSYDPEGWWMDFQWGPWWPRMFQDPDFCQAWIDRWFELRADVLSISNMHSIIDTQAAELIDSQSGNSGWLTHVNNLKNWLVNRVSWIDGNYRQMPTFWWGSGQITPGVGVQINMPAAGQIWYTTDGTDPRAAGGGINPAAQQYTGTPITIDTNTKIIARTHDASATPSTYGFSHLQWSAPAVRVYVTDTPADAAGLAITEINYNPYDPTAAELAVNPDFTSEDFEFVEVRNTSATDTIALGGVKFIDGLQFEFAGDATLAPGHRAVVAANQAAFAARYPGVTTAGQYGVGYRTSHLSNTGARVLLTNITGATIRDFIFNDSGPWPGEADGKGAALVVIDPVGDHNDPNNWQSSVVYGGTPAEAPQAPLGVVVNEVLSHTDEPDVDTIELYNTTDQMVNIGGWFLSDSWGWASSPNNGDYKKFRIPFGTEIESYGYMVFDEDDFNASGGTDPDDFALSGAHGDEVWLMKADPAGNITHFGDHADFIAAANGESFGRWPDGEGLPYPMTSETPGGANSGPRIGPVVITEVMYNPPDPDGTGPIIAGDLEFIELYNPTGDSVDLAAWKDNPHTSGRYFADWRIRGGVDIEFDGGTTIGAGRTLVVLAFDPNKPENALRLATFRNYYGIDASVAMAGGYGGHLDGGDRITLQRPDSPPIEQADFVPHLLEDEVIYDDEAPWPAVADGSGQSLHRRGPGLWGSNAANWSAAGPSPGMVLFESSLLGRHVFYNNSAWDHNDPLPDAFDDDAIAADKLALLPGETASAVNYSNYSRGINGVMVDIEALPGTPTTGDFGIRVNESAAPDTWSAGPTPTVSFRPGDGVGDSDRVTLIWADGAIFNQWVEVTVLATANTGLAADDVFYLANLVGDCDGDGEVGGSDYGAFVGEFALSGGIGAMAADFNADGWVDLGDFAIMRGAIGNSVLTPTVPPAPDAPAAPAAGGEAGLDALAVPVAVTSVNPEIAIVKALARKMSKRLRLAASSSQERRQVAASPNNDAAPTVDLLVELPSAAGYISEPQQLSFSLPATTLQRAATSAYDLRPLSDDPLALSGSNGATDAPGDDLLADILAESPLTAAL